MPFNTSRQFDSALAARAGSGMKNGLRRYSVAIAATLLAAICRTILISEFGRKFPFFFFLLAVSFSAFYSGRGPALLAIGLGAFIGDLFFIRMPGLPVDGGEATRVAVFAISSLVITFMVDRLQRVNEDLRNSARALAALNDQLHSGEDELTRTNARLQASQQELAKANQRLRDSNEEIRLFAYSVSPDLQAPLRTVAAFSQLLARNYRGKLDSDADELLDYIGGGVRRMSSMVTGLLEYSKVTHADYPAPAATDCNELLACVLRDLQAVIREVGAGVTADVLPTVTADAQRLSQVFQNLIGNGLKYRSQEPAVIHVSAKEEPGRFIFSVRDNGIGFEMKYAHQIFQVFERLHTTAECEGTGIGLAIVKRIVERHGGEVWAESEVGAGSTFYFSIPR